MNWLRRFLRDEDGPTTVEYAVILALIVIVAIFGIRAFGEGTGDSFNSSQENIRDYMNDSGVDLSG